MSSPSIHEERRTIFDNVADFLFSDEDFGNSLEAFAKENCGIFTSSEEHKLEYTALYQEYQRLFESKIENYLSTKKYTQDQFMEACQAVTDTAVDNAINDDSKAILDFLLALASYDTFVQMMKQTAGLE